MKNTESTYLLFYTKIWRNNDKHTISWNTVWHCSWKSYIARATRRSVTHLLADKKNGKGLRLEKNTSSQRLHFSRVNKILIQSSTWNHIFQKNSLRTLLSSHTSGFHPRTFKLEPCVHLYNITGSHSFTRDSFNRMFHHKFWKVLSVTHNRKQWQCFGESTNRMFKKLFRKWHHNVIIPEKKKIIQFNLYILVLKSLG